jgi:cell division protein FtsW
MTTFARTDRSLISRWWWTVDRLSLVTLILIAAIGIVLTMAASPSVAARLHLDPFYFARRQAIYVPMAIVVMVATSLLSPVLVRRTAVAAFFVAFGLTVATLFLGNEVKGATRWLAVGSLSLQPSEFLKPALAVVCAWLIAASRNTGTVIGYALATALVGASITVLALQPDIGTTLLVFGAWAVQIFLAGCPLLLIAVLAALFVAGAVGAYLMFDHVHQRVDHFLDPSTGSDGYQIGRAMEAFASGGLFGRGPGEGRVKEVLPDAHADFIFAVAGEEFGFLLCAIVVGLFTVVVLQALLRALKDDDLFVVLAVGALISLFGAQALMNMASTVHLIPPKGTTLPFISYGGSASLALAWTMGMVLALTRERPSWGARR